MIEVLDLSLNFLGGEKALILINALPPQIKELNLSYNYIGDEGAKALAMKLSENFSLASLNLQENKITQISQLAKAL